MKNKRHILVVHTENEPGVLNRIASLFRRRRFNIESIAAGHSEKPHVTRITIVMDGEKTNVEQAIKQMYKIVNVLKITELHDEDAIGRELALIKIRANKGNRSDVNELIDMYSAKIVDLTLNTVTAELSADSETIDKFIELMKNFGVKEVVRTGLIAIQKTQK
ncbi:acetolactate synthase small subunit [Patescibacteria group bacterium]|nr:acetolactate synthase small subunit [Patescibacteria group bacterium]MBU1682927.1 acetolactate synthase small subunit [Patescibacteria group bacterium]MBU1934600.1 acetolactate synthase small subunit [Patescibacteria group bacterium]